MSEVYSRRSKREKRRRVRRTRKQEGIYNTTPPQPPPTLLHPPPRILPRSSCSFFASPQRLWSSGTSLAAPRPRNRRSLVTHPKGRTGRCRVINPGSPRDTLALFSCGLIDPGSPRGHSRSTVHRPHYRTRARSKGGEREGARPR